MGYHDGVGVQIISLDDEEYPGKSAPPTLSIEKAEAAIVCLLWRVRRHEDNKKLKCYIKQETMGLRNMILCFGAYETRAH